MGKGRGRRVLRPGWERTALASPPKQTGREATQVGSSDVATLNALSRWAFESTAGGTRVVARLRRSCRLGGPRVRGISLNGRGCVVRGRARSRPLLGASGEGDPAEGGHLSARVSRPRQASRRRLAREGQTSVRAGVGASRCFAGTGLDGGGAGDWAQQASRGRTVGILISRDAQTASFTQRASARGERAPWRARRGLATCTPKVSEVRSPIYALGSRAGVEAAACESVDRLPREGQTSVRAGVGATRCLAGTGSTGMGAGDWA
jgi:hypothetical protein